MSRWCTIAVLCVLASLATGSPGGAATKPSGPSMVYVTSLNLNSVLAINAKTHAVSTISGPGLNGPLGIAITPNGATAYVTNSLGNTVTPINLRGSVHTSETPITVGSGPSAIAITPNGATAYVSNFNSNTVTPIDLATHVARSPIHVGPGPWSIAVNSLGTYVSVSNSEGKTVSVINVATAKVTTIDLKNRPQAIAVAPDGKTAYVANGAFVTPITLGATPSVDPSISIPNKPLGIAISPNGAWAYTANTDATVTPISLRGSSPSAKSPVSVGTLTQPDGIAVSPNGATAYIANASNSVTPINLTTTPLSSATPINVGSATFGIAVAPDQAPVARLHVVVAHAGKATVLNAAASHVLTGRIIRYSWTFGDGSSLVTKVATATHVYRRAGTFTAVVTETSSNGTSTTRTFTGQTVSNNGGHSAVTTVTFHVTSALATNPSSASPGMAISLKDTTFFNTCRPVYIFFGNRLIGETSPTGHVLDDTRVVIPGDATIGTHQLSLSCTTKHVAVLSTNFEVVATKNHLSEFSVAMPSPAELRHRLAGAGGLSLLMLLISRIISAGFPSEWLDSTYAENRERIQARARRRFPKLFINRDVARSMGRRLVGGSIMFFGFVAVAGLINSFLDRGFGLNRTTLWLYLGQCIGIMIVTLSSQLVIWLGGLREGRRVHLQILVGGMVIAIVCVSASRIIGLSPGYCYGLIAVFHLRPKTDEKDWGRLHAISSVVVLAVSTAAFFLTVPAFHAATSPNPSPWLLIIVPALNVTFLGGFASLAFGMFPLPFLPGRHVRQWNRAAWYLITAVGLIGFVAVLLSPGSGTPAELRHVALIPLFAAFAIFAGLSLVFMGYFHLRPNEAVEGDDGQGNEEYGDEVPDVRAELMNPSDTPEGNDDDDPVGTSD